MSFIIARASVRNEAVLIAIGTVGILIDVLLRRTSIARPSASGLAAAGKSAGSTLRTRMAVEDPLPCDRLRFA